MAKQLIIYSVPKKAAEIVFPTIPCYVPEEQGQALLWAHKFRAGLTKEQSETRAWIALQFACEISRHTKGYLDDGQDVTTWVDTFRKYAEQAGKSIESFGVSEEGLLQIINSGFLSEAFMCLRLAVKHKEVSGRDYLSKMREKLSQTSSPEVSLLGVSEQELKDFFGANYLP